MFWICPFAQALAWKYYDYYLKNNLLKKNLKWYNIIHGEEVWICSSNCGPKAGVVCKVKTYSGTASIAEETTHLQGLMKEAWFTASIAQSTGNETSGWVAAASCLLACGIMRWFCPLLPLWLSADVKWVIHRLDRWNLFIFICFAICISHVC